MGQYLYPAFKIVAVSINKWWKTRYPEYKMRVVYKKEFEQIKIQEHQQQQLK